MIIAHISDIHFGRIAQPGIIEHLLEEINGRGVNLVALSGDLTMRARPGEFRDAATMIEAFEPPTIVVPGNHDVYPWWHPYHRIRHPLGRYKRFISADLFPRYESDGVSALGINSAHGKTVKGGRIGSQERDAIRDFFSRKPREVFKIVVVHHHLTKIQALAPHDVARNARRTLEVASQCGVDLILCGHLHVSHIEPLELLPDNHRIVIASAGTATSNRGRGSQGETNFYNLVGVHPDHFIIEERRYEPESRSFVTHGATRFERSFEM